MHSQIASIFQSTSKSGIDRFECEFSIASLIYCLIFLQFYPLLRIIDITTFRYQNLFQRICGMRYQVLQITESECKHCTTISTNRNRTKKPHAKPNQMIQKYLYISVELINTYNISILAVCFKCIRPLDDNDFRLVEHFSLNLFLSISLCRWGPGKRYWREQHMEVIIKSDNSNLLI